MHRMTPVCAGTLSADWHKGNVMRNKKPRNERHVHTTHSACLSTAARSRSSVFEDKAIGLKAPMWGLARLTAGLGFRDPVHNCFSIIRRALGDCTRWEYLAKPSLIGREPSQTHVALNIPVCSHAGNAERHLTREKNFHTNSACLGTAARSHSRETCTLARRREKTIDLGAQFLKSSLGIWAAVTSS